jgi:hypothetical protein
MDPDKKDSLRDAPVRLFHSFAEAEAADREYYRSLTPQERLDILLEMVARHRESLGEAGERLERVCRITQLGKS